MVMANAYTKRRCVGLQLQTNWLELPTELVELIMKKLGPVDIIRFKAVCSCWRDAANSYISPLLYDQYQSPWLMLPTHKDDSHSLFFNFAEQKYYKLNNVFQRLGFDKPQIVGSSYGWLIIFDEYFIKGCLINPFTGAGIELPSTNVLKKHGIDVFVSKAILSSDPTSFGTESFSVLIMYGLGPKVWIRIFAELAIYKHEHNSNIINTWTPFPDKKNAFYSDMVCHNNHLYALQHCKHSPLVSGNGSIEVWNFDDYFPKKVETFIPTNLPIRRGTYDWFYHIYLAKSLEDILYVLRISSKVTTDNNGADYKDEIYVYKLDYYANRWEEVMETFDNDGRALFLGGNQCISISTREFSEWKENSLYITFRAGIDWFSRVPYFNDVHKVRVHTLQKKKPQNPYMEFNTDHNNIVKKNHHDSTAFWIVPNFFSPKLY